MSADEDEVVMDRAVKEVVAPPIRQLTSARLFSGKDGNPSLDVLKPFLQREGRLEMECALQLVRKGAELFKAESNILQLKYPVTVCGDIHGQFFDLMRLLEVGGDPATTQYLFLGDYVDRGCFSCEVVFYLFSLKILYPQSLFMLRGNHECRQLTNFFNFKDECVYKYNEELYDAIMSAFDNIPLAAMVHKSFFCVHGGLSPDITKLEEIKTIDRYREIPREGPMCDLLWSDPYEEGAEGEEAQKTEDAGWFGYNGTRQCSYVYGVEAVKQFLKVNKLTSVIRAHEAQVDGYKMHMVNKASGIPRVITIFSAPNYCDVYKNKAACLKFDSGTLNIKQFVDSPHPYYLPNFMDVFQWSLPFVAEKVTDMLDKVMSFDGGGEDSEEETEEMLRGKSLLKQKVLAISKLLRVYKTLRMNNESIVQLKQLLPSGKVPFGLISEGPEAISKALGDFDHVKAADHDSEAMPSPATKPSAVSA